MNQLPNVDTWREAFIQATTELGTRVAIFLPSLLAAVIVLLLGWLLARLVELISNRVLRLVGLDRAVGRFFSQDALARAGLRNPLSEIVSRILFWFLMLASLLFGVQTLGLTALSSTIDRLVQFIPDLLGAGLIAFLGLIFARLAGTVVGSGAAAAGLPRAARLGFVVRLLVSVLVVIVAVEQLGVETQIVVGPLTAILATAGFSAGLAFALGAYPIVTHILAGHFLKQSLPRDCFVEVEGERGIVERVGATDTVLRNGEESWSIPNARLLDLTVKR